MVARAAGNAGLVGLLCVCGVPLDALAQGAAQWPLFSIERVGLFGAGYRDVDGSEASQITWVNADGQCYGYSYVMGNSAFGRDAWWYDGEATRRVGLFGPEYQSSDGRRDSTCRGVQGTRAIGTTERFSPSDAYIGRDAWVIDGVTTQRLGLDGPAYVGTSGFRMSGVDWWSDGRLLGYTTRVRDASTPNGLDPWLWDGTNMIELGLHDGPFTGPGGYRRSEVLGELLDGTLFGLTYRVIGAGGERMEEDGQRLWVLRGPTCVPIGLEGPEYIGDSGYFYAQADLPFRWDNRDLKGSTARITGDSEYNGTDPWVWDGTNTVRMGLTGGRYENAAGFRTSRLLGRDLHGHWVGWSALMDGTHVSGGYNGNDAWVKVGEEYRLIGLTGPQYEGPGGFRVHVAEFFNQSGLIHGRSCTVKTEQAPLHRPYIAAEHMWVWDGESVSRVGLIDAVHTHPTTGEGRTHVNYPAFPGVAVGFSVRYRPDGIEIGVDTWGWNGQTSTQTGLTGAAYTGANGLCHSENIAALENYVLGTTRRYLGVNTDNGVDVWLWNGTTTRQVGLTGGEFTSPGGYQNSQFDVTDLTDTSNIHTITGASRVVGPNGESNGSVAWVFDGVQTRRLGLVGPLYRGQAGFAQTSIDKITPDGHIFGRTRRISGVATSLGDEAWHYNPATGVSSSIAALLPVQPSTPTSYFDTRISWVSDEGFALGQYVFAGYVGGSFVYRPDLGAIDPKDLIAGGAEASGWESVYPGTWLDQTSFDQLAGSGKLTNSSPFAWTLQHAFVMQRTANLCPADIGAAGGVSGRDGQLNNNDFIAFINGFFAQEGVTDMGSAGGVAGADGQYDNNDFIVFIDRFFAGCG